ncbi:MAG: hypothetical protein WAU25_08920 [Nitrososphaeraceae archaeon]
MTLLSTNSTGMDGAGGVGGSIGVLPPIPSSFMLEHAIGTNTN